MHRVQPKRHICSIYPTDGWMDHGFAAFLACKILMPKMHTSVMHHMLCNVRTVSRLLFTILHFKILIFTIKWVIICLNLIKTGQFLVRYGDMMIFNKLVKRDVFWYSSSQYTHFALRVFLPVKPRSRSQHHWHACQNPGACWTDWQRKPSWVCSCRWWRRLLKQNCGIRSCPPRQA